MTVALKYLGHDCLEGDAIKPWNFSSGLSLQEGQSFRLVPDEWTTIGRSNAADIQVASNGVARCHLRVQPTQSETLLIEDLGNTNGTQVAGKRIERCELRVGETFNIANCFAFEVVELED